MTPINGYKSLIMQFLDGEISTAQFEDCYSKMFKAEPNELEEKLFHILDELQCDIMVYEPTNSFTRNCQKNGPAGI